MTEEQEEAIECLKKMKEQVSTTYYTNHYRIIDKSIKILLQYIDQLENKVKELESDKQELIDKLEAEKLKIESTYSQINGDYFMAQDRIDFIQEILSILKKN